MKVTHKKDDGVVEINLKGELGHHEAKTVINYMENILDLYTKENIVLNMSELGFMDSSGIAVVMNGYRTCRNTRRTFCVVNTPDFAMKIFRAAAITGIVKILEQ